METVFNDKYVKEIKGNMSVSYVIEDDSLFFITGYKVLQGQEKNGLIKCVRTQHNGKIKLSYNVSGYKTLQSLASTLTPESFIQIMIKLFNNLIDVKSNGFIKCENININFDSIFIDENNLNVHLIYLPINVSLPGSSNNIFESDLKKNILEFLMQNRNLSSSTIRGFKYDLEEEQTTLNKISENLKSKNTSASLEKKESREYTSSKDNPLQSENLIKEEKSHKEPVVGSIYSDLQYSNQSLQSKKKTKGLYLIPCILIFCAIEVLLYFIAFENMKGLFFGGTLAVLAILSGAVIMMLKSGSKITTPSSTQSNSKNTSSNSTKESYSSNPIESIDAVTEILEDEFVPKIAMIGLNTPEKVLIVIDKPEFTIGKNSESVDGAILFNKAISRIHCKIATVDNMFYICDMGSSNGTYVNGTRIKAGDNIELRIGDKIKLANSEFTIKEY